MAKKALKILEQVKSTPEVSGFDEKLWKRLETKEASIGVVGLGYVGLPLACHLAHHFKVCGVDINAKRVAELQGGSDSTLEITDAAQLKQDTLSFDSNPEALKKCAVIIVAVPTPVDHYNRPDLSPIVGASRTIGKHLSRGAIVVYESTVFPGVTEGTCREELEKVSGLVFNQDFYLGYSPERINPGDKSHTPDKIVKVVSGSTPGTLELLSRVYSKMTKAGVYRAPSIQVAEACKITENIQRDVNIALINELTMLYNSMGISMHQVLEAAKTKWNFLNFYPGLVGGHCIGVDPYYLVHAAEKMKTPIPIVSTSRVVNESMPHFLATKAVSSITKLAKNELKMPIRVGILGAAFKENVPDVRNTKVVDLANELEKFGCEVFIVDQHADSEEFTHEYGRDIVSFESLPQCHALILAVRHNSFVEQFVSAKLKLKLKDPFIVVDFKRMLSPADAERLGLTLVQL